ncbi:AI-2E family transporter [Naasia aerilata]|uniref:AI-2E family transporter n=1 Tax=Naasia aerilata TaxID=1162966 RepID=A0ABN6XSL2_9MICO|nr:AI-2E family transporter [Naasia aerilata]BDZ46907.1 AI-2E family transporter [Naasia aerilata]
MAIRRDPDPSRLLPMLTDRLGRLSLRSAQVLIVLGLTAVVVIALVQLRIVVTPLLLAAILAAAFAPAVRFLRRRGAPPALAATVTLLAALVFVAALVFLVVYAFASQWDSVIGSASDGFDELQRFVAQLNLPIDDRQLSSLQESVTSYLTSADFGTSALAGVSYATELLTSFFLLIVLLFFFLKDGDTIWAFLLRPLSPAGRLRGTRIGPIAVRVLGGYVRGTTLIALSAAVPIGLTLMLLRVPLALPLTVLVFLASYIPIAGGAVAGVLAILVVLVTNGPPAALIATIVILVVNQLVGSVVGPVVMSQSVRLHPSRSCCRSPRAPSSAA